MVTGLLPVFVTLTSAVTSSSRCGLGFEIFVISNRNFRAAVLPASGIPKPVPPPESGGQVGGSFNAEGGAAGDRAAVRSTKLPFVWVGVCAEAHVHAKIARTTTLRRILVMEAGSCPHV